MTKKIYIKGYKSVSSLGHRTEDIVASIQQNKSSITSCNGYKVASLPQSSEESLVQFLDQYKNYQKLDRSVQLILWMGHLLKSSVGIHPNSGINISSSRGASHFWEEQHKQYLTDKNLSVYTSPNTTLGNVSSYLGNLLDTNGISFSHSITCSSALHAICNAFAWIKSGLSDSFICGGTESCISPFTLEMFNKTGNI